MTQREPWSNKERKGKKETNIDGKTAVHGRESETHVRYTKQQRNQLNIQLPLTKEMATVREKKTKKKNKETK